MVTLAVVLLSLSHGYSCEWPPQDESTEFADKRLLQPRVLLDQQLPVDRVHAHDLVNETQKDYAASGSMSYTAALLHRSTTSRSILSQSYLMLRGVHVGVQRAADNDCNDRRPTTYHYRRP